MTIHSWSDKKVFFENRTRSVDLFRDGSIFSPKKTFCFCTFKIKSFPDKKKKKNEREIVAFVAAADVDVVFVVADVAVVVFVVADVHSAESKNELKLILKLLPGPIFFIFSLSFLFFCLDGATPKRRPTIYRQASKNWLLD